MKTTYNKADLPLDTIRKFLEPGPIVLVSSSYNGKTNIMSMGWHTVMGFYPALIGCYITPGNHSYKMIERSGECVINIPTIDLIDEVIGIGNTSGRVIDKFEHFGLTPVKSNIVDAPMISECYANYECRVYDRQFLAEYNFFILEVVKAHAAVLPEYPQTVHYRGEGTFMVSGENVAYPERFKPQNL